MSLPRPHPHTSSIFDADDPVIGSHPLLTEATVPRFGVTDQWNLNGVIRRPARLPSCAWTLVFSDELTQPSWNLLAREISMILLNPRHPAVTAAGLSLKPAPAHPTTVISELSHLRRITRWAHTNDMAPHLSGWQEHDLRRLIADLREQLSVNSVRTYIGTLKMLHHYGPALTGGGLRVDPWAGRSSRQAAHTRQTATVSTPVIPPQQWFALIRAAWTYVHTFAPDILARPPAPSTTARPDKGHRIRLRCTPGSLARRPDQPHSPSPKHRRGRHGELGPAGVDARMDTLQHVHCV